MKLTGQEPDSNPNTTRGLVHSSPTEPSACGSWRGISGRGTSGRGTSGRGTSGRGTPGKGTSGRGISGRGTSGRGTSGRGKSGRLLPPADSPSSYRFTLISEVFPTASISRSVGATRQGFCSVTRPICCSLLRVGVSGVRGRGEGSRVCGRGAGAGGCGRMGMLVHLLALLRYHGWLIVYHGISIVSG
jgi:hypothetical protein